MKLTILKILSFLFVSLSQAQETAKTTPLFDGKSLTGWTNAAGKAPGKQWEAADGILHLKGKGGGDLWTTQRYGDFILELEFKTTGNSGVFFRTDDPKQNVQTGIEIQVDKASDPGKHSVGAIYDLQAPSKNLAKDNDWNKYKITCKGPVVTVELNGEKVNEADVSKWTEAEKNPDGSKNKYKRAIADWKREGFIGFQDHGHEVWYRNISLTPLK